jgi:excisionase family DNA binding protein
MSSIEIAPTAHSPDEPLLLRAQELARLLNISLRTLWRLHSARALPQPMRLGAAVRWRMDEIKQWIAAGCPSLPECDNSRTKNSRS